ncbi:MAG: branched-chain alpha-keto acid dehydrogenase subunit E2 [Desulfobulbus propionicus]|nr:MAG: branched-chain alpha-keto acid dehydrogenase subunit E2 [Desulfobulbus propionicus]
MATEKITIPDFGDVQEITVVEIYVSPGDAVEKEDELIALESEKAVMDIPSTAAGIVKEIYVKEEEVVTSGTVFLILETKDDGQAQSVEESGKTEHKIQEQGAEKPEVSGVQPPAAEPVTATEGYESGHARYHATPSVRGYARELGVELGQLQGSGPKGRIQKEDVQAFVKKLVQGRPHPAVGVGPIMEEVPLEDFSRYGEIEERALGRIQKISGPHLHRSWLSVPHVTHFDEADVTDLEQFRKQMNAEGSASDPPFIPLVALIKAVVAALKAFPTFNAAFDPAEGRVIIKHYYHIGIAVDTPAGLVVPVLKDADTKGLKEIAGELQTLSQAALAGKLTIAEMQGASFTLSSLGGIGGTGFTPIVSAPQVAILGLSRNYLKPVWNNVQEVFEPRLTLPFSLSYDHRVIDGAEAARFCRTLRMSIEDLRRVLL